MAQLDARPPFAAIDGAVPPEFSVLPTPCYLLDEAALTRNAEILGGLARRTGCKVLLAQKAFSNYDLYPLLAPHCLRCRLCADVIFDGKKTCGDTGKRNPCAL